MNEQIRCECDVCTAEPGARGLLCRRQLSAIEPRPPQSAAVRAIEEAFQAGDRAQLRMACGVGKSLAAVLLAGAIGTRRVAVAVPSLDLVVQTLQVWAPLLARGAASVAVCSGGGLFAGVSELAVGPQVATTSPGRIGFALEDPGPTLVVSTYQSLPRLAQALQETGCELDLLVMDEAHHLTGHSRPGKVALDAEVLPARRRLAMTATPRLATEADKANAEGFDPFAGQERGGLASMDDERLFGPVGYSYTTREAIDDGYLCDYEVVVVSRVDTALNRDRLPLAALAAAAQQHGVRRALSFHNRVAEARAFASQANSSGSQELLFSAESITGSTPASTRRQSLERLSGQCSDRLVRVVTAARCLREGVDVCAVDAVLFAAPRSSTVDIVQAVGRVLRTHPGKSRGVIIIPLLVPPTDGVDDDELLSGSTFGHVWKVLRALNSHDQRVAETFAPRGVLSSGPRQDRAPLPPWLQIIGTLSTETVTARLVAADQGNWQRSLAILQRYAAEHDGAESIVADTIAEGFTLGKWITTQRSLHRRGLLAPGKADLLEAVPGWLWSGEDLRVHRTIELLAGYAAETGSCRDSSTCPSSYPSSPGAARIGRWLARTRRDHRSGRVSRGVQARLETLPGWTWEPLDERDRAGVEALRSFVAWEGTSRVPIGHVEGGFELSSWLDECGRSYLGGRLSAEVHEEILAVCPSNAKKDAIFAWDVQRLRAQIGLDAVREWTRAGRSIQQVKPGQVVSVDGSELNLYQWLARQRWLYRRGEAEPAVAAELERAPGWVWDARPRSQTAGAPVQLPAGVEHGHPHTASHYGCPCRSCVDAAREYASAWKRRSRVRMMSGWVRSPNGAARVKALMTRHPDLVPVAIAAAAGMPRVLLGQLLADPDQTRIPPWMANRLEVLSETEVRPWARTASRGRPAAVSGPGDPLKHARLLSRLRDCGWSDTAIAGELGYRGSTTRACGPEPTAALVHALELLVASLDDALTPPSWARAV